MAPTPALTTDSWRFQATCGHVKKSAKAPARRLCVGRFSFQDPIEHTRPDRRQTPRTSTPCRGASWCTMGRWARASSAITLRREDFGGKAFEGCNDHLVLTRPDVISEIHESFLAAGCDVLETCTFQSTPRRLEEWGLLDKAARHQRRRGSARARVRRQVLRRPDRPRFVAGSIGPTGLLPSSSDPVLSNTTFGELSDQYYQQAKYLVEGGVDVLLVETVAGHPRGEGGRSPGSSACSRSSGAACRSRRRSRSTPAGACCWAPTSPAR